MSNEYPTNQPVSAAYQAPAQPPAPKKKRWGLRIFVGILAFLMVGFFSLIALLFFTLSGKMKGGGDATGNEKARGADTLVIRFNQPMRDSQPPPFAQVFGGGWITPHQVIQAIHKAEKDDKIKQLLIEPSFGMMPGWARTDEIRRAVLAFKKANKKAFGYAEFADMQGYFLLSACDKISMPEGGDLLVNGFLAQFPLYKGTLAKMGIQPEFIHAGAFKSYSEAFMNDETSAENKQQINELIGGLYDYVTAEVGAGRKLSSDQVKTQMDHGFFLAPDAKAGGLIDDIKYRDEVEHDIGGGTEPKKVSVRRYLGLLDNPGGMSIPAGDHIALLHATGDIVSGDGNEGPFGGGDSIASDAFVRNLREIGRNEDAKIVVLSINSPGGSALASDVMWRELVKLNEKKKVVVSMANVAASGGYYMAMGGDRVFALPTTITGSIGVVSGKFNVAELYNKIGYKKELFKMGANADLFTEVQPMRPEQAALLEANMAITYKQFVNVVAKNRKKSYDDIHALAQGRVYTGTKAKEIGLVDELGGIDDAIAYARKTASLGEDAPVVDYPRQKNFFDALFQRHDDRVSEKLIANLPPATRALLRDAARFERLAREPILLYEPVQINGN